MDPVTAIFILILFFGLMRRHKAKQTVVAQTVMPTGIFPYEKKSFLLNKAENALHQALQSALGNTYKIYLKVDVEELLMVKRNISASARSGYLQKINAKCADFVLCDPNTLEIICVIMLETQSSAQEADPTHKKFVDDAFKAATLPLLHFKSNYAYNQQEITASIQRVLAKAEASHN